MGLLNSIENTYGKGVNKKEAAKNLVSELTNQGYICKLHKYDRNIYIGGVGNYNLFFNKGKYGFLCCCKQEISSINFKNNENVNEHKVNLTKG